MLIGLNQTLHRRRLLLWIAMIVCAVGIALATSHAQGPGADGDAPGHQSLEHALCGVGEALCAVALFVGFVLVKVRQTRAPPGMRLARAIRSALSRCRSPWQPSLLILARLQL
jgi:hypothetical protein